MDNCDISPDKLPVSLGYAMIIQSFDAYEWKPPHYVVDCIENLFSYVPKKTIEQYPTDTLFQKMMIVGGYIEYLERLECIQDLRVFLVPIQAALQKLQETHIVIGNILGINAAFIWWILEKRIHLH